LTFEFKSVAIGALVFHRNADDAGDLFEAALDANGVELAGIAGCNLEQQ
jgi:hypothetical protein